MHSLLQARHAKVTPLLRELFVVVHRLLHRLRDTQPAALDDKTHDASGARIVVEDSETENEVSAPALGWFEALAFAKALELLEAHREVPRVLIAQVLLACELSEMPPNQGVAVHRSS